MELIRQIQMVLEKEELYRNPDLNLSMLAAKLGTSSVKISHAIRFGSAQKTFHRYINNYRLGYFISLLHNKNNDIFTIYTLAQMAGFNSKTTFSKFCLYATGLSPSNLRREILSGKDHSEIMAAC